MNFLKINADVHILFQKREQQIDLNIQKMDELHRNDPNKYPLLPISNAIKNNLYNGMIGGKNRHNKTMKYHRKSKNKMTRNKKTYKNKRNKKHTKKYNK